MNLRKIIIVFILFFAIKSLSAQTSNFKFGVKGGLNLSTAIVSEGDSKFKQGYHIGGTVDYLLTSKFELQSGLFFSKTGSIIHDLGISGYRGINLSMEEYERLRPLYTNTFNTLYLKLPLHVAYRKNLSDNFNIYTGFGLYFGYGIGGKSKKKSHYGGWYDYDLEKGPIFFNEFKWDTFDGNLSRFDFGAGVNAGVEFHKFVLGAGFEYGKNIDTFQTRSEYQYRNVNISISTGYRF